MSISDIDIISLCYFKLIISDKELIKFNAV